MRDWGWDTIETATAIGTVIGTLLDFGVVGLELWDWRVWIWIRDWMAD